jgi:hypothetical protein
MRWSNNPQRLYGTSDVSEIVDSLNCCAGKRDVQGPRYYLLSLKNNPPRISNVPPLIYEKETTKKYSAPKMSAKIIRFIEHLQKNIDIVQNGDPFEPGTNEKEDAFTLNDCYKNSKRLFQLVKHLYKIKIIPKKYKVKIVLGYIVSRIPLGTNIGNIVVENDLLFLHDWHIWNYINNFLIDLSLFKDGNLIAPNRSITSWGDAKSHVFITPPNGIEYFGKFYTDLGGFNNRIKIYFEQPE